MCNQSNFPSQCSIQYNLAADQCVDDFDNAAFLVWSDNVKQESERHNSFVEKGTIQIYIILERH
ncbi:hypothetical protein MKW98_016305, partial [Papaver atlanticum]